MKGGGKGWGGMNIRRNREGGLARGTEEEGREGE